MASENGKESNPKNRAPKNEGGAPLARPNPKKNVGAYYYVIREKSDYFQRQLCPFASVRVFCLLHSRQVVMVGMNAARAYAGNDQGNRRRGRDRVRRRDGMWPLTTSCGACRSTRASGTVVCACVWEKGGACEHSGVRVQCAVSVSVSVSCVLWVCVQEKPCY